MKSLLLTSFVLHQADGTQGGGDPLAIDPNAVAQLIAGRILAINPKDTPETDPRDPDNPRLLNYPVIDDSPINYAGYKSLKTLAQATAKSLADKHKAAKDSGKPQPAVFLNASVETEKELINLRMFSFKALNDVPFEGAESYITAGITRRTRVKYRGGNTISYGKVVAETAPIPKQEEVKTAAAAAKPATV